VLMALSAGAPALAVDIYQWVDENGVINFSHVRPADERLAVTEVILAETNPPDFDPEEDRYGIEAQAERMQTLRQEMEARRESQKPQAPLNTPAAVPYRDPYKRYSYPLLYPPYRPVPPIRPEPPIAVPYETATLKPRDRP